MTWLIVQVPSKESSSVLTGLRYNMERDDEVKSGCLLFPPAGGNVFSKFPKKVGGRIKSIYKN